MKKKKASNMILYGIMVLFTLLVTAVEVIKNINASKTYAQVLEHAQNPSALIGLPIFSIAIVFIMTLPKKNI